MRRAGFLAGLGFGIFLFHSFGQPLFDHGLVVKVAAGGEAFQPTQHAGIHADGDGGGLLSFAPREGGGEESGIELVVGPVRGLLFGVGEKGNFLPLANEGEIAHRDSLALRS